MEIITQDLINVAKNITKKYFNFACNIFLWPAVNNIFDDSSDKSYINSSLKIKEAVNKTILETYKLSIPEIDNYFCNSEYRKSKFYKSDIHSRCIVGIFGELNIERNYYTDKNKKNGFYLIDELFNFEKYTTFDPIFRALLIDNSVNINPNNTSIKSDFILGNYSDYLSDRPESRLLPGQGNRCVEQGRLCGNGHGFGDAQTAVLLLWGRRQELSRL